MRPQNVQSVGGRLIGTQWLRINPKHRTVALGTDPEPAGVVLSQTPHLPAASVALPPDEFEARVERYAGRADARLPLFRDGPPGSGVGQVTDDGTKQVKRPSGFFVAGRWYYYDDLRVCNCAGCGRILLGESDEPIRESVRHGETAWRLPPPVAVRVHGRPVCDACRRDASYQNQSGVTLPGRAS